ncbi:MAG: hypothetical protein ACK4NO_05355 [Glycocaulis sp.]
MKAFATGVIAAVGLAGMALADGPAGHVYEVNIPSAEVTFTATFHADGRMEDTLGQSASWTYADGLLCIGEPEAMNCQPFQTGEVGDSVTTTDWTSDGSEMIITRVE